MRPYPADPGPTSVNQSTRPGPRARPGAGRRTALVVGAGAFGGWTAWFLCRAGLEVTLVDAWGPGNVRASSGGESRVLRHAYGARGMYTELAARSRTLWMEHETLWRESLYRETGLLGLVSSQDESFASQSLATLERFGHAAERIDPDELAQRFPVVSTDGVRWAFLERQAGVLSARRSARVVRDAVVAAGGRYVEARATLEQDGSVSAGTVPLAADAVVVCAGPWLTDWLPASTPGPLTVTRQEIFCFGLPAGDRAHGSLPVWFDHGERFWYGIPAHDGRGFKLADDTPGEAFDPTGGDRTPTRDGLERARAYLSRRFPALGSAPLLEARVCQYTSTTDDHFVLDRHPEHPHLWLVGGGSGHGFKHGPAMGELTARCVCEDVEPPDEFRLAVRAGG